jgi:hypothetical protein
MNKTIPQKNINRSPMNSYLSKSHQSLNLQQSPKISSKKFRRNITIHIPNNDEKLFSARDIDLKKTNQRGTKLPIQYIRRNDKELQEIITGKKNYNSFRNENTPIKAFKRDFPSFDERKVSKNKYYKIENIKENNINKRPKTATSLHSRNVIKKNIPQIDINKIIEHNYTNKSVDLNNNRIHTESDRYLPKGFLDYHKYITNPNYYKETIDKKIKEITPLYKSVNYKEIKTQALKSDIFMQNTPLDRKELNYNAFRENHQTNVIYMESDIFNRKSNLSNFEKEKMGEKFLFKSELAKNKISSIAKSNSDWVDKKTNILKTTNLPSTKYNIISPGIMNEIPVKNEVKIFNKTKGLDEFNNLTRVTATNPNIDYINKIKENPFAFRKVRELCSDYIESYCQGKSILSKPFGKENIIK